MVNGLEPAGKRRQNGQRWGKKIMNWTAAANEVLKWSVVGIPLAYFGYKAVTGLIEDWPHAKKRNAMKSRDRKREQALFL